MNRCVNCNEELEDYVEFCTNCGTKVERKSIADELLKYKLLVDNQTLKIEEYDEIKKGLLNNYKLYGDKIEEIEKFKKLLDDNGINEQEFSLLKEKIFEIKVISDEEKIFDTTEIKQNEDEIKQIIKESKIESEKQLNIEENNEKEIDETTYQKVNKTVLEILRGIMIAISGILAFGSLTLGFYIALIIWIMVIAIFTSKVKNKLIDKNEKFKDSIITFRIILPILAMILMFMGK